MAPRRRLRRKRAATTVAVIVAFAPLSQAVAATPRWQPAVVAAAPTADPGGPYTIAEGEALTLDASSSTAPGAGPLRYGWDLDGDGEFDDATGARPTVPWARLAALGLDDDGRHRIDVEVGAGAATATASGAVTVTNTEPTITLRGPGRARVDRRYELVVDVSDPGADRVTAWQVWWGDGTRTTGEGPPGRVSHAYGSAGFTHDIVVSVTDEDGTWTNADVVVPAYDAVDRVTRHDAETGAETAELAGGPGSLAAAYATAVGPDGLLYVTGLESDSVERYDLATHRPAGTFVDAGSGGLDAPRGLAFGSDGSLYVARSGSGEVLRYHGATGAFLGTAVAAGSVTAPDGLLFGPGGQLLVSDRIDDVVVVFDPASGDRLDRWALGPGTVPSGLAWAPDGDLVVALAGSGSLARIDGTGAVVSSIATPELVEPRGVRFGPDGMLWVSDYWTDRVVRLDPATGAAATGPAPIEDAAGPTHFSFVPDHQVEVTAGGPAPERAPDRSQLDRAPSRSVTFETNAGQLDPEVDFLARLGRDRIYLVDGRAVVEHRGPGGRHAVKLDWVGAAPSTSPSPTERAEGTTSYFRGSDPGGWLTGIRSWGTVTYDDLYPGVDIRYVGGEDRFRYDLLLDPGVDPAVIGMDFDGASEVTIAADGWLQVTLGRSGSLELSPPFTYQPTGDTRTEIASRYVRRYDGTIGFQVAGHDPTLPLVIDPTLEAGTYLGGTGADEATDVAVDAAGNVYVTGSTDSATYPATTGPLGPTGGTDVIVTKLAPDLASVVYTTYIGGKGTDVGYGIDVDGSGSAYVGGQTTWGAADNDFPTTAGAWDTVYGNGNDGFVLKLNGAGTALVYSTYAGTTTSNDQVNAVAVDASGRAYVTGQMSSGYTTTAGAYQTTYGGGMTDAFLTVLNATGSGVDYSTYLGGGVGGVRDEGHDIAVDPTGNAYITGQTNNTDFPVTGSAYQGAVAGGIDAFVTKLDPAGGGASDLLYSTYLGGSVEDIGFGIVESGGRAHVTGRTSAGAPDFPTTAGAFDTTQNGNEDGFVTVLDPALSGAASLAYSTFVGGAGRDEGLGIDVDGFGRVHVTGLTSSNPYPVTADAYQPATGGARDAFVTVLDPASSGPADLRYSTYLGGAGIDSGEAIGLDGSGDSYVGGTTESADFDATAGAYDEVLGGTQDAFVATFGALAAPGTVVVNSTADVVDLAPGDGACDTGGVVGPDPECTLRAAVQEVNASASLDIIDLPAGTYTFTIAGSGGDAVGDLNLTTDMTIRGGGMDTTIVDAALLDRVFDVPSATTVVISDLTVRNGRSVVNGGGIRTNGTLSLTNVSVRANEGSNGGGIRNDGALTMTDVELVSNNSTADGGGMFNNGTVTWTGGTASGNSGGNGGGIRNSGPAGQSLTLTNVTLSGNTVGGGNGGGLYTSRGVGAVNVTIADNVAGFGSAVHTAGAGSVTMSNSIVANDTCGAPITASGGNIESPGDTCGLETANVAAVTLNLAMLADNGGPTETRALLAPSVAIDPAPALTGAPADDQRGFARDANPDVGAYEHRGAFEVNSTGDAPDAAVGDGLCDTGGLNASGAAECTLRAVIEEANASPAVPDSVTFAIPTADPGYSASPLAFTITPDTPLPAITSPIALDATSQAEYAGDPVIQLDGSAAAGATAGILIWGNDSSVGGFIVHSFADEGIEIDDQDGDGDRNTVFSNWVGIDASGTARPNADYGILVTTGAADNRIGLPGQGNVVSGNTNAGIAIRFAGTDRTEVVGNLIGVAPDGVTPRPNGSHGIEIYDTTVDSRIGGTGAGEANTIAHNNGAGIAILATAGSGHAILGNSIHDNVGLGIDLGNDGVTLNSNLDSWLDHPAITAATESAGTVTVDFDLDVPAGTYRVEAFTNPSGADGSGHGEGEVYETAQTIVHTGTGPESFQLSFAGSSGDIVTLTATEDLGAGSFGSTSEHSAAVTVSTLTFQEGVGGYSGTVDTWVSDALPNQDNSAASSIDIDSSPVEQGLIRFDGIVGVGPGQIPPGAMVTSASLTIVNDNPTSPGATLSLHRMLTPWAETDTWNMLGSGVQTDDVEASTVPDVAYSGPLDVVDTVTTISGLESAVQSWVDGNPNHGWLLLLDNTNGVDFRSSENVTVAWRPLLSVTYDFTPNTPPVLDPVGPQSVDETTLLAFTATATDAEAPPQTLTFSLEAGTDPVPAGASITAGGDFTWTPTEAQGGRTYRFKIRVTDSGAGNLFDEEEIAFTVDDTNSPPILDPIGNQSVDELTLLAFTVTASDTDIPEPWSAKVSDSFTEAADIPITAHTPDIGTSWTEVHDSSTATTDATIDAVLDVLSGGSDENFVGQAYTAQPAPTGADQSIGFTLTAVDTTSGTKPVGLFGRRTDNDNFYFLQILPDTNAQDSVKLYKSVAAVTTELGTIDLTVNAGDTFVLEITDASKRVLHNGSEVLSSADNELTAAGTWGVYFGDFNGASCCHLRGTWDVDDFVASEPRDSLTFSAIGLPAGATLDPVTGDFAWTPTAAQGPGVYPVTFTVTDDGSPNLDDSEAITITVTEPATVVTFQEGVSGYSGTVDTWVSDAVPDQDNSADTSIDTDITPTEQGLLRFDGIVGSGPGQIPPGATVLDATLTLRNVNQSVAGANLSLHRMLAPWAETDTWNILDTGVQTDDVEAVSATDVVHTGDLENLFASITITGLEAGLQTWVDGAPNRGWLLLLDNNDGLDVASSEHATGSWRPELSVTYRTGTNATIVVNSTGDAGDTAPGDGSCTTGGTVGADPECTLRAAIEEANGRAGADTIDFAIPTSDPGYNASPLAYTFTPASPYPYLTDPVVIDARTQAEWAGDPVIQLDGTAAVGASGGLILRTHNSAIHGFIVHSFPDEGLEIDGWTGFGDDNVLTNNWIGFDVSLNPRPNADNGLLLTVGAARNTIGGAGADDANVIGHSTTSGITIRNSGTNDNVVIGNIIGVGPDALTPMANTLHGVAVLDLATGNRIGGSTAAEANTIASNSGAGVAFGPGAGADNPVLGNVIRGNGGLGIDLGDDGVTANDPGDGDTGPNDLLNFPVLEQATVSGGLVTVSGTLDVPAGTYRLELFTNPAGADPSGYGEGELLAAAVTEVHPGGGTRPFVVGFPGVAGDVLTATLTEDLGAGGYGSSSELSAAITALSLTSATAGDLSQRRTDMVAVAGLDPSATSPGVAGPALGFDGVDDLLEGPAADITSTGLSLAAWVRLAAPGTDPRVVAKTGAGGAIYELYVDSGTGAATATVTLGGVPQTVSGGVVGVGTWHHLAATWDGSDLRLFVDGNQVDAIPAAGALDIDSAAPLTIGNVPAGDRPLSGDLDHVQVRHQALAADAIATHHANLADPGSFVILGAEQTSAPNPWTVGSAQTRSGGFSLEAPETSGPGAAAWAVATGLDEPGMVFESYWWLSSDTALDAAAGTRAGLVPTDEHETAMTSPAGWDLRTRQGDGVVVDAPAAGVPPTGTWVEVEIWTDQTGTSRVLIDGVEIIGWTPQGAALGSGSVALRAGARPPAEAWYVDDTRGRRLVIPEPVTSLGPLDRG